MNESSYPVSRRNFVKSASLAFAAASVASPLFGQGLGQRTIKVAVIRCGGRGTFMLGRFIAAAKILDRKVEVVAVADAFAFARTVD